MPCDCIYFGIVAIHLHIHKNISFVLSVSPTFYDFVHFFQYLFLLVTHKASRLLLFFFNFYKENDCLKVKV